MEETKRLPRLTFEEVLKNQIILTKKIQQLIRDKRTLNEDEQDVFMQMYRRATVGLGARAIPHTNLPGMMDMSLDDIVTNHLSIPKSKGILIGWAGTDEKGIVTPARAWRLVLERLNVNVFGAALERVLSLSPEKPGGKRIGGLTGETEES